MTSNEPSRIQEIPTEQLTAEQQATIEAVVGNRGRLLTPYKVWLHSPRLMGALEMLGTFLNKASALSEAEVELGIVLIAQHWKGAYVFAAHVRRLPELGVPQTVVDQIKAGATPRFTNERQHVIFEVLEVMKQEGAGSDQVFDRATNVLGRDGLADLLALFGYYTAVAMAMKFHRVPIPK